MGLSTTAQHSDGFHQSAYNLMNFDFLRWLYSIIQDNIFVKNHDHILEKNTASGTIILVPGFTCRPSTLNILAECLKMYLWENYNIIFAKSNTSWWLNHIDDTNSLGTKLLSNLQDIHKEYETNGNMIIVGHSLGWPVTIKAVLSSAKYTKKQKKIVWRALPRSMNIHMVASPLWVVPTARYPLGSFLPVLTELRKSRLFTDKEISIFLSEIWSLTTHITGKDSLVPQTSQDITQYNIPELLREKVNQILHPYDNHCSGINGNKVELLAKKIAEQIHWSTVATNL